MSQTMKDWQGKECAVSAELYRLKSDVDSHYTAGTVVRLIGGVDGHVNEPGYHFNQEYQTVTDPNANPAHFIGVKRSELELVVKEES